MGFRRVFRGDWEIRFVIVYKSKGVYYKTASSCMVASFLLAGWLISLTKVRNRKFWLECQV